MSGRDPAVREYMRPALVIVLYKSPNGHRLQSSLAPSGSLALLKQFGDGAATSRESHCSPGSGTAALASETLLIFNFRSPSASIDPLTHVPRGAV